MAFITTKSKPANSKYHPEGATCWEILEIYGVVFVSAVDPVASGIVPRLDRPGGNATGFALFEDTLGGKSGASATLAPWLTPRNRGGLAPWQLRRVFDYLEENLANDVSLAERQVLGK